MGLSVFIPLNIRVEENRKKGTKQDCKGVLERRGTGQGDPQTGLAQKRLRRSQRRIKGWRGRSSITLIKSLSRCSGRQGRAAGKTPLQRSRINGWSGGRQSL